MNSRRLIIAPEIRTGHRSVSDLHREDPARADICGAKAHVRFTPNSDRESEFPHNVMSALPPKADITSFDHLVGARGLAPWRS